MIGEFPNKSAPDINWLIQRLRIFGEWKKVQELIEKLVAGDIIIYDGALKADIAFINDKFWALIPFQLIC